MDLVLCFKLFDELTRSQILVLFEDCNSPDKYYQSKAVLLESEGGDDGKGDAASRHFHCRVKVCEMLK